MIVIRRIIDELRQLINLLKSAVSGSTESPPGNINVQRRLYINSPIADPKPCSREQAAMLYRTLDGFQQQFEKLSSVRNDEELEVWFGGFNDWTDKNWGPVYANMCDGTSFFTRALRATALWAVLKRVTNIEGTIRADATMELLLPLMEFDMSAMEQDISPNLKLQLNRIVRDLPLCSETRTEAFYPTIDNLEEKSCALLNADSYESLQAWVLSLGDWLETTWGEFYDNPCGLVLEQIFHLQSRLYLAACMQYNENVSGASNILTKLIADWRSQAARDLAIIQDLNGE